MLFAVFELLKEGEVLVVPTDNPMTEKEAWLAFRDVVHGLEYRKYLFSKMSSDEDFFLPSVNFSYFFLFQSTTKKLFIVT